MELSKKIHVIGNGLAYEKSTPSQVKSAGQSLLKIAPEVAALERRRDELVDALKGALAPDLLPLHSPEWVAKAQEAIAKAEGRS